jgi:hypothetical protein
MGLAAHRVSSTALVVQKRCRPGLAGIARDEMNLVEIVLVVLKVRCFR